MPPKTGAMVLSGDDDLVLWARFNSTNPPASILSSEWYRTCRAVAFDEFRNEYKTGRGFPGQFSTTNLTWWNWTITAFPRSGKIVGLRLLRKSGSNDWRPMVEFVTRNPSHSLHPYWKADPLPFVNKVGKTIFELYDLQVGNGIAEEPVARAANKSQASFRVTENGTAGASWELCGPVTVSESNGNHYNHFEMGNHLIGGTKLKLDEALDPLNPWKLSVGFVRTKDFPKEEVYHFDGLLLGNTPGMGTTLKTNINGAMLQVDVFGRQMIHVYRANLGVGGMVKLLSLEGDGGQVINPEVPVTADSFTYALSPTELNGCKTFNLTVAVTKPVFVEFIAKPTWVTNINQAGR
jgi:hypothetical protein